MKKSLFIFLFFVLFIVFFPASAQNSGRKLTIMVYMCGSNLESQYSAASDDIEEMKNAGVNNNEVSLLVMTGGSSNWQMGFDPSQIYIHEISSRGMRVVWQSDKMDMGNSSTLTWLLKFGKENRPAEQYALILWDHGGGPLEGVCWDELFSLDNLSLKELENGIEGAGLGQKLSWIGFDACLMSSLEVASALEPYADYMIASQETEPSHGWNYSFLSEVEKDANGAETGRRIVDTYFDGQENCHDILTMACIDLAKAAELTDAIDDLFRPINESITPENFAVISGLRMVSRSFGRSFGSSRNGEDCYDLVDAADLISHLFEDDFPDLFEDAVVYNRTNAAGASGLSLYHPYENKSYFLSGWRDDYERLKFSPAYTQYIKSFGTILTGEKLVDWRNLETIDDGIDPEQQHHLSLQLTQEQAEHFASAQLVILANEYSGSYLNDYRSGVQNNYRRIYVSKGELNEKNQITAAFSGKSLFLEDESGNLDGPLSFEQSREGDFNYVLGYYSNIWPKIDIMTQFIFDAYSSDIYPEILQTRVWDSVTGTFTNRLAFSESEYRFLSFPFTYRFITGDTAGMVLPRFENWEINSDLFALSRTNLPGSWKLRFSDGLLTRTELYAMFQVSDVQQNVYSSTPIPIKNPNAAELSVINPVHETQNAKIEFSAEIITGVLDQGLQMKIKVTNLSEQDIFIDPVFDSFVLNGNQTLERVDFEGSYRQIPANETDLWTAFIDAKSIANLDRIHSISFLCNIKDSSRNIIESFTPEVSFEDILIGDYFGSEKPLAEMKTEDIYIKLLSIEPSGTGFTFDLYVENNSGRELRGCKNMIINNIQMGCYIPRIPDGANGIYTGNFLNTVYVNKDFEEFWILSDHVLERNGIDYISDIKINYSDNQIPAFSLHLYEPWKIREYTPYYFEEQTWLPPVDEQFPAENGKILLFENDQFKAELERAFIGEKIIGLALNLTNKSDQPNTITFENACLNRSNADCLNGTKWSFETAPDSMYPTALLMDFSDWDEEEPIRNIRIDYYDSQERSGTIDLTFKTSVPFGQSEPTWFSAADFAQNEAGNQDQS